MLEREWDATSFEFPEPKMEWGKHTKQRGFDYWLINLKNRGAGMVLVNGLFTEDSRK